MGHDCIINNSIYIINFGQETQQKEVMITRQQQN